MGDIENVEGRSCNLLGSDAAKTERATVASSRNYNYGSKEDHAIVRQTYGKIYVGNVSDMETIVVGYMRNYEEYIFKDEEVSIVGSQGKTSATKRDASTRKQLG